MMISNHGHQNSRYHSEFSTVLLPSLDSIRAMYELAGEELQCDTVTWYTDLTVSSSIVSMGYKVRRRLPLC